MRVLHNGSAPAFQAGRVGSIPITRSTHGKGNFYPLPCFCVLVLLGFSGASPIRPLGYELRVKGIINCHYVTMLHATNLMAA